MVSVEEVKQKILEQIYNELNGLRYGDTVQIICNLAQAYKDLSIADVQIMPLFDDVADNKATGNISYEEETNIGFCD